MKHILCSKKTRKYRHKIKFKPIYSICPNYLNKIVEKYVLFLPDCDGLLCSTLIVTVSIIMK